MPESERARDRAWADTSDHSDGAEDFFEMSLDNLCVSGLDGYFRRVNPSWARTLGWTVEELLARPVIELVHPDDREATLAGRGRLKAGTSMGPLQNRYMCKDGTYRWFEWRSVAHLERGLVYAAARDITEQKLAEERLAEAKAMQEKLQRQLILADRMASVGTLAAGVAHEINNPLSAVMANLAMLIEDLRALADGPLPSSTSQLTELASIATDAHAAAARIQKIVRGLKTFARAEEERRTPIDIRSVLELAIDMSYNEIRHRARLVKDYGPVPVIEADEARLGQVFIDLLLNAAQAIADGDATRNEIRVVTSTDAAGRAVIEVRDTGAGIPKDALDRVFDPFFTTKPVGVGTGLGLSICHNIVTGMGGEISASTGERGTTFRVVLPPADALTAANDSAPARRAHQQLACASVLVVDDEPVVGNVLRRVLRDHEVTVVTTAKAALELLSSGGQYDVIFSDVMMPQMSGMELYEELSRRFPDVVRRVVFVSGGAFTPAANAFLDRVANARIEKPFEPQAVRDLVQRMIR